MRTANFLAVLVIGVALAEESSPGTCWQCQSGHRCCKPQYICGGPKKSLEDWCDDRFKAAKENTEYLLKRALAFDLTNCLQARNQADCDARKNCFWFRGNDCIPRDLVP
ncbi:uncharacterized protein LOC111123397 isoform X3 [Crassostrea virginica]